MLNIIKYNTIMKTSVTKIMMSFALMGCLILGASDASAQGRGRSQGGSTSSRSQSAAVSRSSSATAPSVSRNSSPSVSRSSSATPQVNRGTTSRSSATPQVSRSSSVDNRSTTQQVNRSSSSSTSRPSGTGTSVNRGATTRGGSDKGMTTAPGITRRSDNATTGLDKGKATRSDRSSSVSTSIMDNRQHGNRPGSTTKPNDTKGGKDKPNGGMDKPNGNKGGHDRPNGGMDRPNGNKGGHDRPNGSRPNDSHGKGHGDNGKHGGNHGYNPKHRYDYSDHHYRNDFHRNFTSHNWSRPLPPPARPYRPAPIAWYRPVIPAGWHPYAGAPIIDRILGITFGTIFDTSLDFLYSNGYYIDGYADGIIYLRDVPMLSLYWSDAMLNYELNRLVNAQFVFHSTYYTTTRFNRVYNSLTRIYGPPVFRDGMTVSWYGGNNTGWVTLSMSESYGNYYTTMSIGY